MKSACATPGTRKSRDASERTTKGLRDQATGNGRSVDKVRKEVGWKGLVLYEHANCDRAALVISAYIV